jgi:uncharacterized protein with NAD-binding domain and iron-sulfur cluster
MVNTAGSLQYRPEASTEVPNLFLASDYVKTYTDVACRKRRMRRLGVQSTQFSITWDRLRHQLLFGL